MCTYTEMVQRESERKGERRGVKQGIEKGKTKTLLSAYLNMKKANFDDNAICSYLGITMRRLATLKKLLSTNVNLEPKTV